MIAVEWGPVAGWAGAGATAAIALVTVCVALGYLSPTRPPRLAGTFEPTEPWIRDNDIGGAVFWVRIAVENIGPKRTAPARGCVGRVVAVTTDGIRRFDVDTVQLRWASLPEVRAFESMDIRNGQREFLDVVTLRPGQPWRIVTFEGFDPGFVLDLERDRRHVVEVAVFSDNATTVTVSVALEVGVDGHAVVARA